MPVELNVKFDPAEWQGFLDMGRATKAITDVYLEPATKFMALGAAQGLRSLLSSKVSGVTVSATGTSARNLFVAKLRGGGLHGDSHAVYEGALTSGNYYIRAGSRPGRPPMQRILAWIMAKGTGNFSMNVHPPPVPGAPMLSAGSPAQKRGFTVNKRTEIEEIAWAIAGSIAKKGTSVSHKPLYPGGQKRYDYVTYAVKKLKMLNYLYADLKSRGLPALHRIMVGYWKTGRYNKGSGYNRVRPNMNFGGGGGGSSTGLMTT